MSNAHAVRRDLGVAAGSADDGLWHADLPELADRLVDDEIDAADTHGALTAVTTESGRAVGASLWRALYHFNLYRLVLGVGLLALSLANARIAEFGSHSPTLFFVGSLLLAGLSMFNMITITQGVPSFRIQACLQISCDIALITLLMYSSGGVSSGLGLLLLVSIAAAGVVLPGKTTIAFAGLATVAVFFETFGQTLLGVDISKQIPGVAMLGVALFATAFVLSILSEQIRSAEELADQRAEDLMTLARVNAHIVRQLDSGVLITDKHNRIYFTNERARSLLGIKGTGVGARLDQVSQTLSDAAAQWPESKNQDETTAIEIPDSGERFVPRFLEANGSNEGVLVFLDSVRLSEEKAQQIKLASLGRLTAAISHEIRNPLAALSHAAELLSESDQLLDQDRRLVDITLTQSARINTIIKSVLQFSRREEMTRQTFDLLEWCEENAAQITLDHGIPAKAIDIDGESVDVVMNSAQLQQILGNLCDNAIRHSPAFVDKPIVTLEISRTPSGGVQLDVVDSGSGIDEQTVQHLFEPFFTTHVQGTGLGLYICRELCEANGASLNYIDDEHIGSRFRVTFEVSRNGPTAA